MSVVLLSVSHVSKHFGDQEVLRDVSLELRSGDHVALVGPNGAGKSTLLRILTGEIQADGGTIEFPSSATLGYLRQHAQFEPDETVWSVAAKAVAQVSELSTKAEQVAAQLAETDHSDEQHQRLLEQYDWLQAKLLQHDAYNWEHRVERVLDGLGFSKGWYERRAQQLSGGQQNRLMLVCLLLAQPDIMILDEPNNHLDIESTEWLENTLKDWPGAFLLVSHDRFFLDQTANVVQELYDGTLDRFKGNYSAYVHQKAERLEVQRRTYERSKEQIAKLEDFVRKHHHGQKSAQAEDRRKKLSRIELPDLPREIATPRFYFPPAARSGDIVLQAKDLHMAYDKPLFQGLNLQIERGQRWAILGSNGCGKSTLLKCLLDELKPQQGEVKLGHKVRVGYFDQLLKNLPEDLEAAEAIRVPHRDLDTQARRDILGAFGITGDLAMQTIGRLSGGEKNRVMLARLSALEANVLVMDEPTNHLDLWSRHALEQAIKDFDGTVLLVTHDRYLVNAVADQVLVLRDGQASHVPGNYDSYRHWLKQGLAIADRGVTSVSSRAGNSGSVSGASNSSGAGNLDSAEQGRATAVASNNSAGNNSDNLSQTNAAAGKVKRKRKFPYRKVADLEADIEHMEVRLEQAQADMLLPENLRDGRRMKELQQQLVELESQLQGLYEHYEEACELN